jgi:hypothetical protein
MGSDVRLAGPAELHPPKDVVALAEDIARRTGARITVTNSPAKITVGLLAFAVMAAGVTVLTRTAPQDLTPAN